MEVSSAKDGTDTRCAGLVLRKPWCVIRIWDLDFSRCCRGKEEREVRGLVWCRIVSYCVCSCRERKGNLNSNFLLYCTGKSAGRETVVPKREEATRTRNKDKGRTQMPGRVRREVHSPRRMNRTSARIGRWSVMVPVWEEVSRGEYVDDED